MTLDMSQQRDPVPPTAENKLKVLFVAGLGRSGSTVLSNIVGEAPGFASVGEIMNLWQRGVIDNKVCGCGEPFWDCPFWSAVFEDAFGSRSAIEAARVDVIKSSLRNADILRCWLPGGKQQVQAKIDAYSPYVEKLFTSIQKVTNCSVIVDASKIPIDAFVLASIPRIELYILHLVRDPRAVAYSWMKKKLYDSSRDEYMEQLSPFLSTLIWSGWNTLIELVWKRRGRYMLLHYEDLMRQPQPVFQDIMQLCDESAQNSPFVSEHVVALGPNHNVSGNPSRFETGQIELKLDDQWASEMHWRDRAMIDILFLPFLARYGYGRKSA